MKLARVQHDIVGKSFMFFLLIMISSQLTSTVFAAIMVYAYLGALGCQFVGSLLSDNVVMRKLRVIGLIGVATLCGLLYWALIINPWCSMFYFRSTFSLSYKK